jgi:hypothetical protein
MTVLSDYARQSYKKTKDVEYWLDSAMASTSSEEFRWKYSEAVRLIKQQNKSGDNVMSSQAFGSE